MRTLLFLLLSTLAAAQNTYPTPGPGRNASAGNSGFAHVRSITLDHTKVGSSDSTDFPILVTTNEDTLAAAITTTIATAITVTSGQQIQTNDYITIDSEIMQVTGIVGGTALTVTRGQKSTTAATHLIGQVVTDNFLGASAVGGAATSSSGYDVIFSSDALGNTKLACEIIAYTTAGPAAWAVKEPTMSHTTNPVIYVSYGNSSVTTNQCTAANVWTNNYVSVWHLGNASGLSTLDSLGNNNGTNVGVGSSASLLPLAASSGVQAQIPKTYYNPPGLNYINLTTSASDLNLTTLTLEYWELGDTGVEMIYSKSDGTSTGYESYTGAGSFSFQFGDGTNFATYRCNSCANGTSRPGVFNAISITGNTAVMYQNGSSIAFSNIGAAATGIASNALNAAIGARPGPAFEAQNTQIQELRVSNVVRSADYVLATYNAWGTPYSFETIAVVR